MNRENVVSPGEQWFFYWKTSAALWEARILELPREEIVFLPLNWGMHAEAEGKWDFGQSLPERDLGRLANLLTQHGRKFTWLLPLTPSPFLPNGGIPVNAARTLALCESGTHLACLDHEGRLHKMYSWYEPKVFHAWTGFLGSFGEFLATKKIKAPVWGARFSYKEGQRLISFLTDTSLAFEQGFSRYLRKNNPEGIEINDPSKEIQLKSEFAHEVGDLFRATAEAALGPFWSGSQEICVLGSGPRETLERGLTSGKPQVDFFQDIFELFTRNVWVSSALLTHEEKKDLLPRALTNHFGQNAAEEKYHYRLHAGALDADWRPFSVIDVVTSGDESWEKNGLVPFLENDFRWLYSMHPEIPFTPETIESSSHKIKFFHGKNLDRTGFSQMLKLFMMGHKIVLDKTGLAPDLEKRLQVFYLENNLKVQDVNYQTNLALTELGEGKLITLEGHQLAGKNTTEFWKNIFRFIRMTLPEVIMDREVFCLWNIRATGASDLNFIDVRRINLYNPTSYKKSVTIRTHKHFAFMKMIDPERAQAKSTTEGVQVELLPNGTVALDFGHFEEN
ncbi:MAG: hypothetical protein ACJ76H_08280 [Bacteriovoracaceae bacterium]